MKNTFGNTFSVTIFGESHGPQIGIVIDCPPSGIEIDYDLISFFLQKRKSDISVSTSRNEPDNFKIISGIFNGFTTGTPLTVIIDNLDTESKSYDEIKDFYRPSHADYTADIKYNGFQDYRGGGHFSGRITAAIVIAGAIATQLLNKKGITVGTHIKTLYNVSDSDFSDYKEDIDILNNTLFPVLNDNVSTNYKKIINTEKQECDSVGGILETAVFGIPAGLGEPWFDSIEGMLSHILFSIPGIKGVEFGAGFSISQMKGSEANDQFIIEDGEIRTKTNNNGGINGGITNGMPIVFRCAVKPTPSISKTQRTVNKNTMTEATLNIKGRHDPCFIHRASVVVDAVTAICITDILATKHGLEWFN